MCVPSPWKPSLNTIEESRSRYMESADTFPTGSEWLHVVVVLLSNPFYLESQKDTKIASACIVNG